MNVQQRALSLPAGVLLLAGIALIVFALHGWDAKYNLLGGKIAGDVAHPGTKTSTTPTTVGGSTVLNPLARPSDTYGT